MKIFQTGESVLYNADNMEVLKSLPDNSIDSVVTDPPYGISFMAKKWDYDVPSIELWQEVLRVLKPGGHILVACGTRTQHRMVVNIEDAGFEIRDVISWVYGSGFPKSYNVGKGIEKLIKTGNASWNGTGDDSGGKLGYHKLQHIGGYRPNDYTNAERTVTEITTDEAKQFEGWGTALKPACEFFTLARKPISETNIAENVLKWGTGGINIDECRVEGQWNGKTRTNSPDKKQVYGEYAKITTEQNSLGRFPANFIHDGSEEVVGLFPETKTGSGDKRTKTGDSLFFNGKDGRGIIDHNGDSGSAARFFYCAKASPSERNEGLEGLEEKSIINRNTFKSAEWNIDPRSPNGGYEVKHDTKQQNHHPTVKPIALMEYLIKLITPKGGTVLDPFAGSGTTGIAAINLKVKYILIEREEEYCTIADARLKHFYNKIEPELFEAVNAF